MSEIRVRDALLALVTLEAPARRVVSLVPSVTETLFELGVGPRVVGCTTFCVHPRDGVASLARVGGTKDPDVDRIVGLGPDLVLANREENREEDVERLRRSTAVHVSYPRDLAGLAGYLGDLGAMLGVAPDARAMIEDLERAQAAFQEPERPIAVAYLIWRRPYMAAGRDNFIDAMLAACGFRNVVDGGSDRYPEVDLAKVGSTAEAVLLSSEPFPFGEGHRAEVARAANLPLDRVQLVSGEAFSWFGCRTRHAFAEASRVQAALTA